MSIELDALDRGLISGLRSRPRPSVSELGRTLGVARATVQSRIARLEETGVILGYGPDVSAKAAGMGVVAFVTIEISQGAHDATIGALSAIDEILEVHTVTGPGDLLCRIVARTNDHLHEVLQRVARIDSVGRTQSHLALSSPIERSVADAISLLEG